MSMLTGFTILFFVFTGGSLVLQSLRAPQKERGEVIHYWTLPLEIVTSAGVVAVSIHDVVTDGTGWGHLLAGAVVFRLGTSLFRAAQEELGRYWSLHIELRADQPLITRGSYAARRHPAYLGLILEVAGFPIAFGSWHGIGLLLATFVPVVLVRVWLEEQALERRFGEPYRVYKHATPAFGGLDVGGRRAAVHVVGDGRPHDRG